jgi:hypothetical protein
LKTDSIPIYGNGYKPKSLKFRLRANAEILYSVRYDIVVVVVSIIGGSEKFLYRMVRSQKLLPLVPLMIVTTILSSY